MAYATMEVKAQSGKLVFAGRVLDEETQEPIPYAAVQIYAMPDSTFELINLNVRLINRTMFTNQ